jgi:hypothetical protein
LLVGDVDGAFWSALGSGGEELRVGGIDGGEVVDVRGEARADQSGAEILLKGHAVNDGSVERSL